MGSQDREIRLNSDRLWTTACGNLLVNMYFMDVLIAKMII